VGLFLAFYAYALSFPGAYENGGPTPWPSDPLGIAGAVAWFAGMCRLMSCRVCVEPYQAFKFSTKMPTPTSFLP